MKEPNSEAKNTDPPAAPDPFGTLLDAHQTLSRELAAALGVSDAAAASSTLPPLWSLYADSRMRQFGAGR